MFKIRNVKFYIDLLVKTEVKGTSKLLVYSRPSPTETLANMHWKMYVMLISIYYFAGEVNSCSSCFIL